MNYLDLRRKYPVFSYDKFDFSLENNFLIINFYFSAGEYSFIHKLKINNIEKTGDQINKYIFNVGLSLIPSYWKPFCSPTIYIKAGSLTKNEIEWWHKLFIKGMGEYFYKNQIIFTEENFITLECRNLKASIAEGTVPPQRDGRREAQSQIPNSKQILIPVGGGKDSIVTLELLKSHFDITAFVINPVPLISEVIKKADVPSITVENIFDPKLFELNRNGYLNGHVPVSAFYAFTAVLTAYLRNISYVAFSNEGGSGEGNTNYLGQEINHQYSKTLEFETDLNNYLKNITNIKYFSFLRPIYELQITKIFSQYPQYFDLFSSCNNNFKISNPQQNRWCQNCPKCVSTSLMLACFTSRETVTKIMGIFPPDLPINKSIIDELTGKSEVKPFECVLTRSEAQACIEFLNSGHRTKLDRVLNSWQDNPNLPKDFEKILKENI